MDLCPKVWTPQPNWRVMSLYGGIYLFICLFIYFTGICVQSCGLAQPNWLDIFVYGDLCPKLWTPQPNWFDIGSIYLCRGICDLSCGRPSLIGLICLCRGIYVQSCGYPSLTGLICLCTGIYVQSCGHPSLTGLICCGVETKLSHNWLFYIWWTAGRIMVHIWYF